MRRRHALAGREAGVLSPAPPRGASVRRPTSARALEPARPAALKIGLLNNMPDAALKATERQFAGLLKAAAGDIPFQLRLYALRETPRGDAARAYMRGRYAGAETLESAGLDALIVTGAEPRAPDLAEEPYWPGLTRVIDWAERATLSAVWSCLAAHAAVQHLDGIRRRPLAGKLSGVFACEAVAGDPLLAGLPNTSFVPHSRYNGLDERDLTGRGYGVLTRSDAVGVDAFVRRRDSLFLFFQGHPEYDADSLQREYLRDVGRFLRGERPIHPATPVGYFNGETERLLEALAGWARFDPRPDLIDRYAEAVAAVSPDRAWRPWAVQIYGAWLGYLVQEKTRRDLSPTARLSPIDSGG